MGIYRVMALGVSHRVNEFRIRLALGAGPGDVLTLVLDEGMPLVLFGMAIGLAGAGRSHTLPRLAPTRILPCRRRSQWQSLSRLIQPKLGPRKAGEASHPETSGRGYRPHRGDVGRPYHSRRMAAWKS
jgi:hypothetical protein